MEDSVLLLKDLLYLFLLLAALRAPICCGVPYKHRGRNGLKKPEGREGLEWAERSSTPERTPRYAGQAISAREQCTRLWWRTLEIPNSRTADAGHFMFLMGFFLLLSLYMAHLPFVFQNFNCKLQILLLILPLSYLHPGDSVLLWGLTCPGLNWSCPEDDFIFSSSLWAALICSSPDCLIQYLLRKSLSRLSLSRRNDKAEPEKGPGPYPKRAWAAEPRGAQLRAPLCHQGNPQALWRGMKFCPTKSVARRAQLSACIIQNIPV